MKSKQCRVSRPQFQWSTHGTPRTMTPLLVTKTLAFQESGFPTEAQVIQNLPVYKSTFQDLKISLKICPQLVHGSKLEIQALVK